MHCGNGRSRGTAASQRCSHLPRSVNLLPRLRVHMESIFNWIERPAPEVHKPPMYKSRHAPKVPPTGSTFGLQGSTALPGANLGEVNDGLHVAAKHGSRTFGRAEAKTSPERFLRKGERMPSSVHDAPTGTQHSEPVSRTQPAAHRAAAQPSR